MKNYTQVAIVSLLIIVILYLTFSFVAWEINPKEWNIEARYFLACICLLITGALVAIKEISNSENK